MALEVIGAGFGRTGTMSLKAALEQLGFGPCYHMIEVSENPDHDDLWLAAARRQPVDWDGLFAGYRAAVDWPAAAFWPALAAHFSTAPVILTERPAADWYRSMHNTIFGVMRTDPDPGDTARVKHRAMAREVILQGTFDGRFEDRDHAIAMYEENSRRVRQSIEKDRLLTYAPGDGWAPLCGFLGVPVPDVPYPHDNTTEIFQARLKARAEAEQAPRRDRPAPSSATRRTPRHGDER